MFKYFVINHNLPVINNRISMFDIEIVPTETAYVLATKVLYHKLHNRGDSIIKDTCRHILANPGSKKTYVWTKDGVKHKRPYVIFAIISSAVEPIACLIIVGHLVQFYTVPTRRRLGFATLLFNEVAKKYDLSGKLVNNGDTVIAKRLRRKLNIAGSISEMRSKNNTL